ncbi:MAG: hypothetical protein WD492_12610 [Alkalispirochaeta sp.]
MSEPTLQIKIGGDADPERISMEDLGEVLSAMAHLIQSAGRKISGGDEDASLFTVHATGITTGSVGVSVVPEYHELAEKAARKVADYIHLPYHRLEHGFKTPISRLRTYSKKFDAPISMRLAESTNGDLFTVVPSDYQVPTTIKGSTTIYGRIMSIGGTKPTVRIAHRNGTISCSITENQARELGKHIYSNVAANGVAVFDRETLEIHEFDLKSFVHVETGNPRAAMNELRERFRGVFDDATLKEIIEEMRR